MGNVFEKWLEQYFDEVEPKEFYRDIFPEGELEKKGEYKTGEYTGIALCISKEETKPRTKKVKRDDGGYDKVVVFNDDGSIKIEPKVYRFTLTDDLELIDELGKRDDLFCLMSPISYAGKSRKAENARFMYAMAFDLDNLRVLPGDIPIGVMNLWNGQIDRAQRLPKPTYIVSSGSGLHLYYVFERPVALFPNVVEQLKKMKYELTWMLWNEGIVNIKSEREIQQEGIFQGFRVPGTTTKSGDGSKARAFLSGKKVTLEYLNGFVREDYRVTEFSYKSKLSKAQAAEKYPGWFEARIVNKKKGVLNPWAVNRKLYDWWKKEILSKAQVGHRYYCMMILAAYAMKCSFYDAKKNPNPVTEEELIRDAYEIMDAFEEMTDSPDNHFDEADVLDALDAYDWGMLTFPRNSVEYRAGFPLPVNKRNGRSQKRHLERARAVQSIDYPDGSWRNGNGRKSKFAEVLVWRLNHPEGTKAECERETGFSRHTVLKWWKVTEERFREVEENKKEKQQEKKRDNDIYIDVELPPFKKSSEDTVKRLSAYQEALRKATEKKNEKE